MTENVRKEIVNNSDRFRTEQTVDIRTGRVVSIELVDDYGKIPIISFTDQSELYEYWCAIEDELKTTNEVMFEVVEDYLVGYDGDYFNLHKPADIRSMVRIMNRIIKGDVE